MNSSNKRRICHPGWVGAAKMQARYYQPGLVGGAAAELISARASRGPITVRGFPRRAGKYGASTASTIETLGL